MWLGVAQEACLSLGVGHHPIRLPIRFATQGQIGAHRHGSGGQLVLPLRMSLSRQPPARPQPFPQPVLLSHPSVWLSNAICLSPCFCQPKMPWQPAMDWNYKLGTRGIWGQGFAAWRHATFESCCVSVSVSSFLLFGIYFRVWVSASCLLVLNLSVAFVLVVCIAHCHLARFECLMDAELGMMDRRMRARVKRTQAGQGLSSGGGLGARQDANVGSHAPSGVEHPLFNSVDGAYGWGTVRHGHWTGAGEGGAPRGRRRTSGKLATVLLLRRCGAGGGPGGRFWGGSAVLGQDVHVRAVPAQGLGERQPDKVDPGAVQRRAPVEAQRSRGAVAGGVLDLARREPQGGRQVPRVQLAGPLSRPRAMSQFHHRLNRSVSETPQGGWDCLFGPLFGSHPHQDLRFQPYSIIFFPAPTELADLTSAARSWSIISTACWWVGAMRTWSCSTSSSSCMAAVRPYPPSIFGSMICDAHSKRQQSRKPT